jgi:hypothetical protein
MPTTSENRRRGESIAPEYAGRRGRPRAGRQVLTAASAAILTLPPAGGVVSIGHRNVLVVVIGEGGQR